MKPASVPPPGHPQNRQFIFKTGFCLTLLLMSVALFWIGYDSGYHSDELDMITYGKANVSYYQSGGLDTTYRKFSLDDGTPVPATMKYYGAGFEYISILANELVGTSGKYEINVRHFLNQLLAILTLLISGLLAKRLSGRYEASISVIVLLFFTPFFTGLAIFDIKDVPLMSGYIAATYFMVVFFQELPKIKWLTLLGFSISLAFSLSVRLVSIMQIGFFTLFLLIRLYHLHKSGVTSSTLTRISLSGAATILVAGILMVISWPYLLDNPIKHFSEAINVAKNFPQRIPFNFDGEQVSSLELPPGYILRSIFITIPVIILAVTFLFTILLLINDIKNRFLLLFIAAVSLFPLIYANFTKAPLYNNWRHILFIYPGLIVLASVGLVFTLYRLGNRYVRYTIMAIVVAGLIKPALWMVQTRQYMYMYYNEFVGSFKGAYYKYETDFWQISVKESLDHFVRNDLTNKTDSIVLVTNAFSACHYYLSRKYPQLKVNVVKTAVKTFNETPWDYAIVNNLFLPPEFLEYRFPPVFNNQYIVKVDDEPLTVLLQEKNNNRSLGIRRFRENKFAAADSLFTLYMKDQEQDILSTQIDYIGLEGIVAFAKYALGNKADGLTIANRTIKRVPMDYFSNMVLGVDYYNKRDRAMALKYLTIARSANTGDVMATKLLKTIK